MAPTFAPPAIAVAIASLKNNLEVTVRSPVTDAFVDAVISPVTCTEPRDCIPLVPVAPTVNVYAVAGVVAPIPTQSSPPSVVISSLVPP